MAEQKDDAGHRDHPAVRGLLEVVSGRRAARRARRLFAGQGLHGHPPVRLRHLGADSAGARRRLKATGHVNAYFPLFIPESLLHERGRARRRLRAAGRVGDQGRHRGARGEARHPADVRGDLRDDVREVDPVVARPARPDQPVGQRRALGEGDASVPAHHRVPLAGRPHRARDRRGSARRDAEDPRDLQGPRRERARHAGARRARRARARSSPAPTAPIRSRR